MMNTGDHWTSWGEGIVIPKKKNIEKVNSNKKVVLFVVVFVTVFAFAFAAIFIVIVVHSTSTLLQFNLLVYC